MVVKPVFIYLIVTLIFSCSLPDQKSFEAKLNKVDTITMHTSDSNAAVVDPVSEQTLPKPQKIRNPKGIYQVLLPFKGQMEQTLAFYTDQTFRLQERYYPGKKDSVVLVEGTWTPSDGYIWLYSDQVVRGRYKWQGEELQYYSVSTKKTYGMNHMEEIKANKVWVEKNNKGALFYGIGNEPFWNIEVTKKDSISFALADWKQPLRMKVDSIHHSKDSTVLIATDSLNFRVTIYPYFCNDNMSDYIYSNSMRVEYKNVEYRGCGMLFRAPLNNQPLQ